MKKFAFVLAVLFFLPVFFAAPAQALIETFTTGKDWEKRMSPKEKVISLIPPTSMLRQHDIVTRFTIPEYVQAIDYVMPFNPELEKEDVSNIFVSLVYLLEPERRPAIENMELQFLKGESEPKLLRFRFDGGKEGSVS